MDVNKVSEALKISGRHTSVETPFATGDKNSLLDILENSDEPSPDYSLISKSLKVEINRTLPKLPKRKSEVIRLYFGLNKEHSLTLEEIGERFHLTRERVRQIKEKAIRKLRQASRSKNLKAYLG